MNIDELIMKSFLFSLVLIVRWLALDTYCFILTFHVTSVARRSSAIFYVLVHLCVDKQY